jgi:ETC complex I subunit conserved region
MHAIGLRDEDIMPPRSDAAGTTHPASLLEADPNLWANPANGALAARNSRSYPYGAPTAWIYQPARSATQSGQANARHWVLRFESREASVPDYLMGWYGGGDTLQQVELRFTNKECAVAYARRHGLHFRVAEPHRSTWQRRSYADNFRRAAA